MNQTEATALLQKYKAGTCSEEEKAALENWYLQWNNDEHAFEEAELLTLKKEMWHVMPSKPSVPKTLHLWTKIAVAAAVVIAVSTGIWFYTVQQREHGIRKELLANDIAPGKNTATLTLANGKTITLSDAKNGVVIDGRKLAYNDGTAVTAVSPKIDSTIMLTAATPRGGTYQVILPDGSKVWLNAASSLKFPSDFNKYTTRKVRLTGEAYFEITKDKTRPFIVATDKQDVEVLGTHFNVNCYVDEPIAKTTLLEGSVKISAYNAVEILKPGEQASLKGNKINVESVDTEAAVAWKNGNFVFDDEDLESIMRKIARWYDMEVYYQDKPQKPSSLGILSRSKNLSALLKVLASSGQVHFKVEGRRIIVMK
jgi:ferric-dicitrate binding protein FerR (iron transport regulator)